LSNNTQFGVPTKFIELGEQCLNQVSSTDRTNNYLLLCTSSTKFPGTRVSIFAITFQLCLGPCHCEGSSKAGEPKLNGTCHLLVYVNDVHLSSSLWCLFSQDKQISVRAGQRRGLTWYEKKALLSSLTLSRELPSLLLRFTSIKHDWNRGERDREREREREQEQEWLRLITRCLTKQFYLVPVPDSTFTRHGCKLFIFESRLVLLSLWGLGERLSPSEAGRDRAIHWCSKWVNEEFIDRAIEWSIK